MQIDIFSILLLIGTTICLGYIGTVFFTKTRIPDAIWLLLFGLLVGPGLGLVEREIFLIMAPLLAAVALTIILFDAGLNMDFYQMVRRAPRAGLLAVSSVILSMGIVGPLAMVLFGFDLIHGLLLGAIIGGTSAPVVVTVIGALRINPEVKTMLELEAILTDPLCIVTAIALMQIILLQVVNTIPGAIASAFSVGAMLGLIMGVIWLFVLDALRRRPFDYMLTLAVLIMLYVVSEMLGGSGAITALCFGVVLGNARAFSRALKLRKRYVVTKLMRKFHSEISFFVRSFFFVLLGVIVTINPALIAYSLIIAVVLLALRIGVVHLGTFGLGLTRIELGIARGMAPRGLAAAVLALLVLERFTEAGMPGGEIFLNVAFITILATIIYTVICIKVFYKPEVVHHAKS